MEPRVSNLPWIIYDVDEKPDFLHQLTCMLKILLITTGLLNFEKLEGYGTEGGLVVRDDCDHYKLFKNMVVYGT